MAKNTSSSISKEKIYDAYWDYLLEEGERPKSVYKFCKHLSIQEGDFFSYFNSFDIIEASFWEKCVEETINTLNEDDEYENYPVRQKILAYCYTFFAHAINHRSKFLIAFPKLPCDLKYLIKSPTSLDRFSKTFSSWIDERIAEAIQKDEIKDRKGINNIYPELLVWVHWYFIDYNLKDNSEKFEATDELIEKVVNLFFDLVRSQVFDSGLDLVKFLIRNKA